MHFLVFANIYNIYSHLRNVYGYTYSSDRIRYFLNDFSTTVSVYNENRTSEKLYVITQIKSPPKDNIVLDLRNMSDKLTD